MGPRLPLLQFLYQSRGGEVSSLARGNSLGLKQWSREKREAPQSCTAMTQRGGGRHGNRRFLSRQTFAACGGSGSKEVWFSYITELCLGSRSAAALCCLGAGCNQTVPLLCVCFFAFFVFRGGCGGAPSGCCGWGVVGWVRFPQSHQQPRKHAEEAS